MIVLSGWGYQDKLISNSAQLRSGQMLAGGSTPFASLISGSACCKYDVKLFFSITVRSCTKHSVVWFRGLVQCIKMPPRCGSPAVFAVQSIVSLNLMDYDVWVICICWVRDVSTAVRKIWCRVPFPLRSDKGRVEPGDWGKVSEYFLWHTQGMRVYADLP